MKPNDDFRRARESIRAHDASLAQRFWAGEDVEVLVRSRARFCDELLVELWTHAPWGEGTHARCALFATGGYGRGELHPFSDVDLLILIDGEPDAFRPGIEAFVQGLWDLSLNIGHSVRTVEQCRDAAAAEITIATSLLERRLLSGPRALDRRIGELFATDEIWPSAKFFRAKRAEQEKRHAYYENLEYNLEPNIKGSPGGLRDIQTVGWIIRRHFGNTSQGLDATAGELSERGFLTHDESRTLAEGRKFLWKVRYGLHLVAGRSEDRLLFDHQRTLAERFGYRDTPAQLAVEQFMHDYYRHVLALREVNDVLLQHFDEAILRAHYTPEIEPINERFQIRDSYMEVRAPDVFQRHPPALMELFVIMAQRRDIAGVRASTIRLVRDHVHLIDDAFRHDPEVTRLFIELLRAPYTLVSQLTRMRRYGVLGRYIPEFGRVIGQMQHDLFHIYTVDAHTMLVIRNMRRFFYRASAEKYPVACHCVRNLPKIELLYIAGLFHDIAKGRGGDHSDLGADDVIAFCRRHRLSEEDTELVEWLVRRHLLMSFTAQRKDIYDPEVVHEFASEVKTETRLDYLYALTVADINATNPTLWNTWRATLLRQLYMETRKALRRGLSSRVRRAQQAEEAMRAALERLSARGVSRERALLLWDNPDSEFFLRHSTRQIVAMTEAMNRHDVTAHPLVIVDDVTGPVSGEGATEIFIFARDRPQLFAASVIAMGELGLSIHDARIYTSKSELCFNSYIVLDETGQPIGDDARRKRHIREVLSERLEEPQAHTSLGQRRIPRRLRQFQRPTQAWLRTGEGATHSVLQLETSDRPGLLAQLGLIFIELGITVQGARITTLGERVEDYFFICGPDGEPIRDPAVERRLVETICQRLDRDLTTPRLEAIP